MLNNMVNLLKGGKNGEVIVAGKPLESNLYAHLLLPESDDKHLMALQVHGVKERAGGEQIQNQGLALNIRC